jgi:hypothetical protein
MTEFLVTVGVLFAMFQMGMFFGFYLDDKWDKEFKK